jgi:hypothetical protein
VHLFSCADLLRLHISGRVRKDVEDMRALFITVTVMAGIAVIVSGCGSDARRSTATDAKQVTARPAAPLRGVGLSASQFDAKANSICQKFGAELAAGNNSIRKTQDFARVVPARVAIEQAELAQLSRLRAPAPLANDWHWVLSYKRNIVEEFIKLGGVAGANDERGTREVLASMASIGEFLANVAKRAGLDGCTSVA